MTNFREHTVWSCQYKKNPPSRSWKVIASALEISEIKNMIYLFASKMKWFKLD